MIVYHNEVERNYLTVTDVNAVLERIVERGEAHFKYIWSESTPAERLLGLAKSAPAPADRPRAARPGSMRVGDRPVPPRKARLYRL